MLNSDFERKKLVSDIKRRTIEIIASIPLGIGFGFLFWYLGLSLALQLFLIVICWGASIVLIDIIVMAIIKAVQRKRFKNPKRDPFSDSDIRISKKP